MNLRLISVALVLVAGVACKDKATPPSTSTDPNAAAAAAAETTAKASPTTSGAADPAPGMATDAVLGFAGFSQDGLSFAWVAPSPMVPDVIKLSIISIGQNEAKTQFVDTPDGRAKGKARLLSDGFTSARGAIPADLTFEPNLLASPPTITLIRGGKRGVRPLGQLPFEKTDVAELWGLSADGTHVAIHIHGKDVPGLLSTGNGGTFHFFFVAQLP